MGIVEWAGAETALPNVTGGSVAGIAVRSIAPVSIFEGEVEGIGPAGDGDEVDVIGHETVAGQGELVEMAILAEKVEINEPVGVGFEDEAPVIPSLCDVVRGIDSDYSGKASHENRSVGERGKFSRKRENGPSVPWFGFVSVPKRASVVTKQAIKNVLCFSR